MTDIFLSYSSNDRERVRRVRNALVTANYDAFWDQDIPAGVNWVESIREHISQASVVITFWSKSSAQSENVFHEASIAKVEGKFMPAMLEPMHPIDIPMGFFSIQAHQLWDWNGSLDDPNFAALMDAVAARVRVGAKEASAIGRAEMSKEVLQLASKAESGDAAAQGELAFRYQRGLGVGQDEEKALVFWVRSASRGNARGQRGLGRVYMAGRAGVAQDDKEAVRLFRLAADQGDHGAQNNLGLMLSHGRGVEKHDDVMAVHYWQLAARQQNPSALCSLGLMYAQGRGGLPRNILQAALSYQRAAELGSVEALFNIAELYHAGDGVEKDIPEAKRLYQLAFDKGYSEAASRLQHLSESET